MRFVIFFSIFTSISFGIQYYVLRRLSSIFEFQYSYKSLFLLLLVVANFVAATMLSHRIWNIGVQLWYLLSVLYVGSVWILFSFLLVYSLVQLVFPIPQKVSQYMVIMAALTLIFYSVFNARQLDINKIEIVSDKIAEEVKIVHVSDFHLGAIHGKNFVERIVTETNALQPDVVIHTGDLFDGTGKISEETLREFDRLTAPVFFIKGNHDKFLAAEHVDNMLRKTSFHVLHNEKLIYNDSLQIIGLDYLGRRPQDGMKPVLQTLAPDNGYFTILLSHVPMDFPHTDGHPIDLLLAGHTHSGQIFPFYFVVKYFYPRIRGLYTVDNRHIYVSSGTGTWGPPMRLGTASEIALIRLSPQKDVAQR